MHKALIVLGLASFVAWGGTRIVLNIQCKQDITGHLKRAADANQPALAVEELETAVEGMDAWGLCNEGGDNCYTSIIYRTPDEDVAFWRGNVAQTVDDLKALPEDADHLEVSNTLMKVRETLMDHGQNLNVTYPLGISVYPNNVTYLLWGAASTVLLCLGLWPLRRKIFR